MASAKKAKPVVKRLGRPPDTSSVQTRERILVVAREMFSVHGYEITTNRDIATAVGITPGALYHYFGSKLALYLAVHEDTQTQVYEQFTKAIIGHETFIDQFEAVLDIAHEMNIEDASVARFIGAVRVDSGRHPDMAAALSTHVRQREGFFAIMIDLGALIRLILAILVKFFICVENILDIKELAAKRLEERMRRCLARREGPDGQW